MSKKFLVPIDLNQLELQNATIQNLATAPASPVKGQIYFNTATNKAMVYNGTAWVPWEANTTVDPATSNPKMDGTVAVGTSVKYAREDHVHPTDTSRVPTSRTVNGHALSANVTVTASDIGVESGAEVNVIETVKVNGSALTPTSKTVDITVPTKTSDLTNDSNFAVDANYVHTDNNYTTAEKTKLGGIDDGAEVNQNSFSKVKVTQGTTNTTIESDSPTDTITVVAGSNISISANTTNDSLTINGAYSVASTSASGLMSSDDKTKLNGIATGAEVNVQANWTETSSSSDAYIKNKPTLGAAAAKDVDTSISDGDTSTDLPTTAAVVTYVGSVVGAADAMRFKGTIGTGGTVTELPSTHKQGDTYRVITAGTYAGQTCEIGDLIIAMGTSGVTANDWTVAQTNIDGAITEINATAPITKSGTGSSRTIGISYTPASGGPTEDPTTSWGSALVIPQISQSATGQVSVTDRVAYIPADEATTSAAGLMSSSDKTKLNGIESGAQVNRTYTAVTGKPTANQTPGFNSTFTISQISQDTTGQISATDRTVKIPALPAASTSQAGIVQLNDSTSSTSTSQAATPSAVKTAYDKADDAYGIASTLLSNLGSLRFNVETLTAGQTSVTSTGFEAYFHCASDANGAEVVVDKVFGATGTTFSIATAVSYNITILCLGVDES